MTLRYALVAGEEIVKFRNVPDGDDLLIGKLVQHDYLPVIDAVPPVVDDATQSLSEKYEIGELKVVRKWMTEERPFEIAKTMKDGILKTKTVDRVGDELESTEQTTEVAATLVLRNQYAALIKAAATNEDLREIVIEM